MCQLSELYIGDNPLGSEGVAHLAEGLARSAHLRVLSMPRVGLGDDAAAVTALSAGMERNCSLTHLDLNYNHLGEAASVLLPVLALKEGGDARRKGGRGVIGGRGTVNNDK